MISRRCQKRSCNETVKKEIHPAACMTPATLPRLCLGPETPRPPVIVFWLRLFCLIFLFLPSLLPWKKKSRSEQGSQCYARTRRLRDAQTCCVWERTSRSFKGGNGLKWIHARFRQRLCQSKGTAAGGKSWHLSLGEVRLRWFDIVRIAQYSSGERRVRLW